MKIKRQAWIYLFCFCSCYGIAQQSGSSAPQQSPPNALAAAPGRIINLDVAVEDPTGKAVVGLQQQDFTLLDDKQPQKILSFHAVQSTAADPPAGEVVIVLDQVNTAFHDVAIARQQLETYLGQNDGKLLWPTSIVYFSDSGAVGGTPSRDGKALIAELRKTQQPIRTSNRSQGIYGAVDRLNLSLRTLGQIADYQAKRPGRKLVIWLSPGWTLLATPRVDLTYKNQQDLFNSIVGLSGQLQRARMTLYDVNPLGSGGGVLKSYYKDFMKGVTSAKEVRMGNLALQVLAVQSGGLVLNTSNDLAAEIATCVNDANAFYVLTFAAAVADGPNEYHALQVNVDKPGTEARTRTGYYAQPDQPRKP